MGENDLQLGVWLRRQLLRRGIRAADFARLAEVSPGMVSGWLNGKRRPSPASCDLIAEALNVDFDEVLLRAGHRPLERLLDDPVRRELVAIAERVPTALIPQATDYLRFLSDGERRRRLRVTEDPPE